MALAHQMYPQRTKYFLEAYTEATPRFWTMYMTLMFLWWLFFVNREATLWSVSSMRSSRMIKCFSLGSLIMALAHQMYPQKTKYFLEAYTAATARPHGYLVIDMKQETPDIFPLKMLSAHSHRQSTRLRSALVMRCLRIHGLAFCKYTNSLACFFKRWETMLRPHGYLVIDMKQETPDILRLRSHIFPGEEQKAYADI
jgi:hypothetical protein